METHSEISFPVQVFEDIDPTKFTKHNKKHVSEDFVIENLKRLGWHVYRPLDDLGIDFIATKRVCPENHTKWYESVDNKCSTYWNRTIEITRLIQVKTKEDKEKNKNKFGYTLRPKDIITYPRYTLRYTQITRTTLL